MQSLPEDLLPLANGLLAAASQSPASEIKRLLELGAPAWYQAPELGWSCLHFAAERGEPEILKLLLKGGAVWNAVDDLGRTAGEVCLSLGDQEGWEIIRNEGFRSEMLHHMMAAAKRSDEIEDGNLTLRAQDDTSAGDNLTFLNSQLTWDTGEDGKERVLDADGNGVMMGWEEPLMVEHVKHMTHSHPDAQPGASGMSIMNVGFGLGIVDRLFRTPQSLEHPAPQHHTIIEAHPQVLKHMRELGIYDLPGVRVLEGRWQDWLNDEKVGEVLEGTPEARGFGAIFVDTFAEGYEDLKAFFEYLPDLLDGEDAIFSFWNGLGATNATIYSVSSLLAENHLEDVGLEVEWHTVAIPDSMKEEVWRGVRRRYWELPNYMLPIAKMALH